MLKRVFDILTSLIGILLLGPAMLIIAAAIRLESRGPAIFRQRRAGWKGRPFTMLKFRTMRADVDAYGASPHGSEDVRLTKVGRFLRERSLDELPQLFNVLAGQMSIVGPRPLYERQAEQWNQQQRRRLEVRPGLSGYAQAYGRGQLTHEDKIELDIYYIDNANFWLDVKIIFKTIVNIFTGCGEVYERQYSRQSRYEPLGSNRTSKSPEKEKDK